MTSLSVGRTTAPCENPPNPLSDEYSRRDALTLAGCGLGVALSGCAGSGETTPTPGPEATVTVRIRTRDDVERSYTARVRQNGQVTNEFSGVLRRIEEKAPCFSAGMNPADQSQFVEMVATVRTTDAQHEVTVETDGGQTGRTWDPPDRPDLLVDAAVVDGGPEFESECRGE